MDLVWSGPEVAGLESRETGAVVRELFARARRSLLVACYAIHGGRDLFRILAERMDREPGLQVRLVVDIKRKPGDRTMDCDLVSRFAEDFRQRQWPGQRLPEVFYDPRSLDLDLGRSERACMHAKCVVIDDEIAFVTSANFTEAAQQRNVELGLLVRQPVLAAGLRLRFEHLSAAGCLLPVLHTL